MAGTGLQLLVVVVLGSLLSATATTSDLLFSNCKVNSTIFLNVTDNKAMETTFWGNIKNVHPFMEIKLTKTKAFGYFGVLLNLTHATIYDITNTANIPVSVKAVPGLVCAGWRRFHLVLEGDKYLTITDDFNTTWIDRQLNASISDLNITVDNFDSSCSTSTPMWDVNNGTSMGMTLPAAQPHEDLRFTLATDAKNCAEPKLFLGNHSIALGKVAPQNPLHLRLKQTPGAVPGKAVVDAWENVIEIGGSSSGLKLESSCPIFVLQHLGHPTCPLPPTADGKESDCGHHHCCCNSELVLAFMWTAAASSVVMFYCLRRVVQMVFAARTQEQARNTDTSQSRPPSTEPVYEAVDVPWWL